MKYLQTICNFHRYIQVFVFYSVCVYDLLRLQHPQAQANASMAKKKPGHPPPGTTGAKSARAGGGVGVDKDQPKDQPKDKKKTEASREEEEKEEDQEQQEVLTQRSEGRLGDEEDDGDDEEDDDDDDEVEYEEGEEGKKGKEQKEKTDEDGED